MLKRPPKIGGIGGVKLTALSHADKVCLGFGCKRLHKKLNKFVARCHTVSAKTRYSFSNICYSQRIFELCATQLWRYRSLTVDVWLMHRRLPLPSTL